MHSTTTALLVTAFVLFASIAKAEESHGNLAVCVSGSVSGGIGGGKRRCLDSVFFDGVPKPSFRARDGDRVVVEEAPEAPILNWRYDNGLLRAAVVVVAAGGADVDAEEEDEDDLCLAPASPLSAGSSEPVDLKLRKCPENDEDDDEDAAAAAAGASSTTKVAVNDRTVNLARTQEMRFVVTAEGRIVSLATTIDPLTFLDDTGTTYFCLTLMASSGGGDDDDDERAFLVPCDETAGGDHLQVFDVHGTRSETTFLMPLRRTWGYRESVLIAYQHGLPRSREETDDDDDDDLLLGTTDDSDAYIEITAPWPFSSTTRQNLNPMVVDTFPLSTTGGGGGGFLSFEPSDYMLDGRMTATLKRHSANDDDDDDDDPVGNGVSFVVSKADVPLGRGPNGQYVIFVMLLGCFLLCFALSVLVERLCGCSRTDGSSNDGKTVCVSVEDQEEGGGFAL